MPLRTPAGSLPPVTEELVRALPKTDHPLRFYLDFGLRVTVNTDNRLVTDTTVSKELWLCHAEMGFTLDDLCTLVVQGFKSAFLPFREKQELLQAVNREVAEVLARFQRPQAVPARGGP